MLIIEGFTIVFVKQKEIIKSDGGLKACSFEFTEFTKKIELSDYKSIVKDKWLLANSSHVIDTAFYISDFLQKYKPSLEKEI